MQLSRVIACVVVLVVLAACTSDPAPHSPATRTTTSSSLPDPTTVAPSATSSSAPSAPPTTSHPAPPPPAIHARPGQLTPEGMWWAVDSVVPISADSLANVRSWYRGAPTPVLWGRYVSGVYGLRPGELAFARAHHVGVYIIVPDDNCSICANGGDLCGNDRTAAQATADARESVEAALQAHLPARVTLFKDIEQVGACYGELSADYLLAWYHYVAHTRYRPGFYGNTNEQSYDFPRAYCAAVHEDPRLARIPLAQDEPEPQIAKPRGVIGPADAPRFRPNVPSCVPLSTVDIWQYGESGFGDDWTDADEIVPGTPGLIAPDGSITPAVSAR